MSNATPEVKFSVKAMINKDETKVLFAQVDCDFADVLLSFLTLPLGTIVRLLKKHYGDEEPIFGSLSTLYNSVADLDNGHFWTETGKQMLLNPRSSFGAGRRKLKLNIDDTPTNYFICKDKCVNRAGPQYISIYDGTARCRLCGGTKKELSEVDGGNVDDIGVFTIKTASFLLGDDLRMVPVVNGSIIQALNDLGIADTVGAKQTTVSVGFNEIMDLLKGSLLSHTPLTDLILHSGQIIPAIAVKLEQFTCPHQMSKEETLSNSEKKMSLKLMLQKSTNKILFAHAEEDFIDFLFSFLTIPLGGVECLLCSNTGLENIDNLYTSIANLYENAPNSNRYLKSGGIEGNLLKPQLPPYYLSLNQLLTLTEKNTPRLYHLYSPNRQAEYISFEGKKNSYPYYCREVYIKDPKGNGSYVMGPRAYMVGDDLTVTPLCISSTVSILNSMKIPLSDVKEVNINIGVQEGLSILKACLTSTCALTNGLSHILTKQPKQESRLRISCFIFVFHLLFYSHVPMK